VLIGAESPILAIDMMVFLALKLILTKDRTENIPIQTTLVAKIKIFVKIESVLLHDKNDKFIKRWQKIVEAIN